MLEFTNLTTHYNQNNTTLSSPLLMPFSLLINLGNIKKVVGVNHFLEEKLSFSTIILLQNLLNYNIICHTILQIAILFYLHKHLFLSTNNPF